MANNGFGAGGFGSNDFEALARQYWNSWGEMMRGAAASAPSGMPGMAGFPGMSGMPGVGGTPGMGGMPGAAMPGWNEAVAWWSQLAKSGGNDPATGANDAIDRFNSQARGWYAQMQQVASQFAGQDASASEITQAWKRALGGQGANPFADMFSSMRGPGQHGFEQWVEQAAPYLQGFERWQRDSQSVLGQPTFGFAREHQERWQQLAQLQLDYQQHNQAYNALMAEAAQNAFGRFEEKLKERSEPGCQLESARALFDLWIDAAEDAYAEIALSPRFRDAYGAMVNSQMRLRAGLQTEIEQATELLGIPTRTEVDAAHRKIVQLERELRRMRDAIGALGDARDTRQGGADSAGSERHPASSPSLRSAPDRERSRAAASKPGAGKVAEKAAKKVSKKAASAKPPAAKPPVAKKSSTRKVATGKAAAAKPVAKKSPPTAARKSLTKVTKPTKPAKRAR